MKSAASVGSFGRHAAAIAIALTINPALVRAQDVLTVTAPSADVYKGPSNVTPVIGHVSGGTVLPIARNLGSWVRIAWPGGLNDSGYVHVTMGRIGPASEARAATATGSAVPASQSAAAAAATAAAPMRQAATQAAIPPTPRPAGTNRAMPHVQGSTAPASHMFGVGALAGYTRSFGATMRAWPTNRLGIQFAVAKNTLTNDTGTETATSTQLEPGFIFGLGDHISDYVWVRPYVGSAVSFHHHSETTVQPAPDSNIGFRAFGGAEFMFASAPQFGVSADLGYRHRPAPYPGFDPSPLTVSIAAHWYIR